VLPLHGSVSICPHLLLCVQLFPYHLASYVCQVLRTTPFKYYCDLLFSVMREERSYDFIPNFTVGRPTVHASFIMCPSSACTWPLPRETDTVAAGCSRRSVVPTQAADIVHVVGIGRNEYINLMNQCKARKLVCLHAHCWPPESFSNSATYNMPRCRLQDLNCV
jgi:FAM91 N-terminus